MINERRAAICSPWAEERERKKTPSPACSSRGAVTNVAIADKPTDSLAPACCSAPCEPPQPDNKSVLSIKPINDWLQIRDGDFEADWRGNADYTSPLTLLTPPLPNPPQPPKPPTHPNRLDYTLPVCRRARLLGCNHWKPRAAADRGLWKHRTRTGPAISWWSSATGNIPQCDAVFFLGGLRHLYTVWF